MTKNVNQVKWGAIISYVQMALSIVVSLIYTPIMIRTLGNSEYGLYNTVSSTISMLSVLSLGFNAGYIRYYSKYKKDGDEKSIEKLNGLFMIVFSVIALVALVCGLFISFNLKLVFDEGLTQAEYQTAKILMILLTLNLSVTFFMSVFTSIISAYEKFVFLKLLGMLKTVVSPLLTIPLLLLGYRSVAVVVVTLAVSTVTEIIYFLFVKFKLKQKFVFRNFEKGLLKSLFIYTSFIAINSIIDQINWNMGKFLLGRYKGTEVVGIFSVGYTLYQYYMTFSSAISGVFTPRIHRIYQNTENDLPAQKKQLSDLFIKVGRIQFILLGLLATGMIFFGKQFIYIWAGEGYEDAYYVMLLFVLPASIALIQNSGIEIQRAENKHQFRSIVYLIMAIINIALSVILIQTYGAIGAAIGTAVSLIVANGFIMNIYYFKKCNIDIPSFWKNILRMSIGLIIPVICGILITNYINLYSSVFKLALFICVYTVIYCTSMYFFGMNNYEKGLVTKPLEKVFKHGKENSKKVVADNDKNN